MYLKMISIVEDAVVSQLEFGMATAGTSLSKLKCKSIFPPIIFENTHYIFVVKTVRKYYELVHSKSK